MLRIQAHHFDKQLIQRPCFKFGQHFHTVLVLKGEVAWHILAFRPLTCLRGASNTEEKADNLDVRSASEKNLATRVHLVDQTCQRPYVNFLSVRPVPKEDLGRSVAPRNAILSVNLGATVQNLRDAKVKVLQYAFRRHSDITRRQVPMTHVLSMYLGQPLD